MRLRVIGYLYSLGKVNVGGEEISLNGMMGIS